MQALGFLGVLGQAVGQIQGQRRHVIWRLAWANSLWSSNVAVPYYQRVAKKAFLPTPENPAVPCAGREPESVNHP